MRVLALFNGYLKSYGVGHACQSILEGMSTAGADIILFCGSADREVLKPYQKLVIPVWGTALGYGLFSTTQIQKILEWRYCRQLRAGDFAYIWPGASIEVYRIARDKGCIVITENINTHTGLSKKILDKEYARLTLNPTHTVNADMIADENAKLTLADYVFSPSPEVSRSLMEANVPAAKIVDSSYGLDAKAIFWPEEIPARRETNHSLNALFIGRIGIRKGVHLLLDYWVKAGVQGRLTLVGNIESDAQHLIEPYLQNPSVQHISFSTDLKRLYLDADVFIFPSLEEGSPLVTYLALGAGLPCLVTPMGGGGVIEDGVNGWVIEPHDEQAWVACIRNVFSSIGMRRRFSENAFAKAPYYVWRDVGARRFQKLVALTACHF